MILQPRFINNLTLAIDWYDIKINDSITTAAPQQTTDLCVDLPTVNNGFCPLIERSSTTGQIISFVQQPLNVAQFTTEGVDFNVNYLLEPSELGVDRRIGSFNFQLLGNHLTDLTFINLPGAAPRSAKGNAGAPVWQIMFDLTWRLEPIVVNYGITYFDETRRVEQELRHSQPDATQYRYLDYGSRFVQNVYAEYTWRENLTLGAGINNLADEEPDVGSNAYPNGDIGRSFFVALTYDLSRQ